MLAEEPAALRERVASWRARPKADAVIVTGGTGIGPRDRTPDAVGALFERGLPGFGELFRMLSFQEIGPAAMLSRADAGVVGRALVFLLPGSPAAVELAVRRLIAPELGARGRPAPARSSRAQAPRRHGASRRSADRVSRPEERPPSRSIRRRA